VLIGIGIALALESRRKDPGQPVGLGLGGAIAINLSGGIVLLGWLLFGKLGLPVRGSVFLWFVAILLVAISTVELFLSSFPPRTRPPISFGNGGTIGGGRAGKTNHVIPESSFGDPSLSFLPSPQEHVPHFFWKWGDHRGGVRE
jgi:hypothetical protein